MGSSSRKRLTVAMAAMALGGAARDAGAVVKYWNNPDGGVFQAEANWDPTGAPGSSDVARFDLAAAYTVTFTANVVNSRFIIDYDKLVLELQGSTFSLTAKKPTSFQMGLTDGDVARMTMRGGTVVNYDALVAAVAGTSANVTVHSGATWENRGMLVIGNAGTGGMTVTAGGKVTSRSARVGVSAGSVGNVTVSSAASSWKVDTTLSVGGKSLDPRSGRGTLWVRLGATVEAGTLLEIKPAGTLKIDGGTVTAGRLTSLGTVAFNAGTINITSSDLAIGTSGPLGKTVVLPPTRTINVTQNVAIDAGAQLVMQDGRFTASEVLNSGEIRFNSGNLEGEYFVVNRLANAAEGLVRGTGRVAAGEIDNYGEIRASGADQLILTGPARNSGSIVLDSGGTVEFLGLLDNAAPGVVRGSGMLNLHAGMNNAGLMDFNSGFAGVTGDVNNLFGGRVNVTADVVSFQGNFVHNGSQFFVDEFSNVVFSGDVTGAGSFTGRGAIRFEQLYSPGEGPAHVSIQGPATFGPSGVLRIGLGPAKAFDSVSSASTLDLSDINVVLEDGFDPDPGDVYPIVSAGLITYNGSLHVPALSGGLSFEVIQTPQSLTLVVIPEPTGGVLLVSAVASLAMRRRRR